MLLASWVEQGAMDAPGSCWTPREQAQQACTACLRGTLALFVFTALNYSLQVLQFALSAATAMAPFSAFVVVLTLSLPYGKCC